MSTYTITFNERNSKAKSILAMLKEIAKTEDFVKIEDSSSSPYNKSFVDKIKRSEKEIKQGKVTSLRSKTDIKKLLEI